MGSGYRADNSLTAGRVGSEPGLAQYRAAGPKPNGGAASRCSPNPSAAPSQSPIPDRGEAAQTPTNFTPLGAPSLHLAGDVLRLALDREVH